jgi:hypothetical protein
MQSTTQDLCKSFTRHKTITKLNYLIAQRHYGSLSVKSAQHLQAFPLPIRNKYYFFDQNRMERANLGSKAFLRASREQNFNNMRIHRCFTVRKKKKIYASRQQFSQKNEKHLVLNFDGTLSVNKPKPMNLIA